MTVSIGDVSVINTRQDYIENEFLQFVGSKFGPSEQLLLIAECVILHGTREPDDLKIQSEFDAVTFKQKVTWKLQMKSWNNKSVRRL